MEKPSLLQLKNMWRLPVSAFWPISTARFAIAHWANLSINRLAGRKSPRYLKSGALL